MHSSINDCAFMAMFRLKAMKLCAIIYDALYKFCLYHTMHSFSIRTESVP